MQNQETQSFQFLRRGEVRRPPPMANPEPAIKDVVAASAAGVESNIPAPGSKRQRRPSVRLGVIGEQPPAVPHESLARGARRLKNSNSLPASADLPRHPYSSQTRPLSVPAAGFLQAAPSATTDDRDLLLVEDEDEPLGAAIRRSRNAKARRSGVAGRQARSSWTSSSADVKSSGAENADEEGRGEFEVLRAEDSESPSDGELAALRVRVAGAEDMGPDGDAVEGGVPSENNGGDWNHQNGRYWSLEYGGVLSWLGRLGLDRYAPVFEIHRVDDQVLPFLTMEDLKDMGINAVGPRRKMYYAIQKLKKELQQDSI